LSLALWWLRSRATARAGPAPAPFAETPPR
jgi:hypothetical protein